MSIKAIIKPFVISTFTYIDYLKQWIRYNFHRANRKKLKEVQVLNTLESIDYILLNNCSLSRFGDGELLMAWQYITGEPLINNTYFQKYDEKLGQRLAEILQLEVDKDNNQYAIGISYSYFKGVNEMVFDARRFLMFFVNKYSSLIASTINTKRIYLNSELTRFYITRKDKSKSEIIIKNISRIWDKRNVCFIEGFQSRLGYGNDLFDNAKTIKRILCPAENAYAKYDEIFQIAKQLPKNTLFIIALGMTATVLAYDLYKSGYQALDLGHIDIEYEWFRMGVKKKVPIPHKYTNEADGGKTPLAIDDDTYEQQIFARII